jgi:hypothetical protein
MDVVTTNIYSGVRGRSFYLGDLVTLQVRCENLQVYGADSGWLEYQCKRLYDKLTFTTKLHLEYRLNLGNVLPAR